MSHHQTESFHFHVFALCLTHLDGRRVHGGHKDVAGLQIQVHNPVRVNKLDPLNTAHIRSGRWTLAH